MRKMSKFQVLTIIFLITSALIPASLTTSKYFLVAATQEATDLPSTSKARQILQIDALGKNFGAVTWVGWRPGHKELAIIYEQDTAIRILDVDTGKLKLTIQPPTVAGGITSVRWSPDGKYLACSVVTSPDAIYIWDLSLNVLKDPLVLHHTGQQASFSWNPNNQQLISVGAFGEFQDQWKLFVWDITKDKPITEFENSSDPIVRVSLSPDGRTLATFTQNAERYLDLQLRDATSFKILDEFPVKENASSISGEVSWSSDSAKLVGTLCNSVSGACSVWIWNIQNDRVLQPALTDKQVDDANMRAFTSSVLSPDGNNLVTNAASGTNFIWDMTTSNLVSSFKENDGEITSLSWSPDSIMLATGDSNGSVRIWKVY